MSQATLNYQEQFLYGLTTFKEIGIAQLILIKTNSEGVIFWSYNKIAQYFKISIRTVQATYKKLIQAGKIRKTGMYKGKTKRIPVYEVLKNNGDRCVNSNQAKQDTINNKELYIEKKEKGEQESKPDQNTPNASPPPKPPKQKKPWSPENEKIFSERFKGRDVRIEDMYEKCHRYKADRAGNVSDADFKKWILETDVMKFRIKAQEVRSTIKEFAPPPPYTQEDREKAGNARHKFINLMKSYLK